MSFDADKNNETEISLIVTNGYDKLYRLVLSYEFMTKHRQKVGIEGSWQAYFDLLKQAIADGDKGIKVIQIERP